MRRRDDHNSAVHNLPLLLVFSFEQTTASCVRPFFWPFGGAAKRDDSDHANHAQRSMAAGPTKSMKTLTVLLVDDHEGFVNAAMRHFRKVDWLNIVGSAANGLEAIAQSERLRPQVVLMDLAMPEMGGLQATRLIKTQDEPPYIVIASHFDDAEHRDHALRSGADHFVSKLSYIQDVMPILQHLITQMQS